MSAKIKNISLSLTNDRLLNFLKEDKNGVEINETNKVWINPNKIIENNFLIELDKEIREKFKIDNNLKCVINVYMADKSSKKETIIKNSVKNSFINILICTTDDIVTIIDKSSGGKNRLSMKKWNAYYPFILKPNTINYEIDNKNTYQSVAKKGFRVVKKSRKLVDRYFIKIDYIMDENNLMKYMEKIFGSYAEDVGGEEGQHTILNNEEKVELNDKEFNDAIAYL